MKNLFLLRKGKKSTLPLLFFLFLVIGFAEARAVTLYGVNTANQLVRFDSATPGTVSTPLAITGLQAGENILGIDFRPANGQLYGLGSTSRLYLINPLTGLATVIGSAGAFTLSGTDFGFNFNPTVDRIRVVSNTGQNLRLNPDTGALAATDTALNPGSPNIVAAAYANNFAGATSTTLYDIDRTTNSLYTQNPPNNGTLNLVGPLGVVSAGPIGFDIASTNGVAYASITVAASTGLYTVNLSTGAATLVGPISGVSGLRGLSASFGSAATSMTALDYDGDRRADWAVFRTSTNVNYVNRSSNGSFFAAQFGVTGDIQTPGDYDGDGLADLAVWRPTTGFFYVLRSSTGTVQTYQFGLNGDEPVARDYDGDGKTDFAVVRRTGGQMVWYINNSRTNTFRTDTFGLSSDITAPGDYDGDGKFDLGTFRGNGSSPATFYTMRSTAGFSAVQFGLGSDLVVPGDYDGDGKTDYAVVRQGSNMTWYILRSSDGGFWATNFGSKPDYTAQGDYDGDGRTDIAIFRPQNGTFYVLRSSTGSPLFGVFGANGDYPIANYDTH